MLSYLGGFGGGLGIIPFGWDLAIAVILSVSVFYPASWCRLSNDKASQYIAEYGVESGEIPTDEPPN